MDISQSTRSGRGLKGSGVLRSGMQLLEKGEEGEEVGGVL